MGSKEGRVGGCAVTQPAPIGNGIQYTVYYCIYCTLQTKHLPRFPHTGNTVAEGGRGVGTRGVGGGGGEGGGSRSQG